MLKYFLFLSALNLNPIILIKIKIVFELTWQIAKRKITTFRKNNKPLMRVKSLGTV